MALRSFLLPTGLGILTAFGLFWAMQALVSVSGELKEAGRRLTVDFVRLRKDTKRSLHMCKAAADWVPPGSTKAFSSGSLAEMSSIQASISPTLFIGTSVLFLPPRLVFSLEVARLAPMAKRSCWIASNFFPRPSSVTRTAANPRKEFNSSTVP